MVPKKLQTQIIQDYHGQNHGGVEMTLAMLRERFWFKGMQTRVLQWVKECQTCQQGQRSNPKAPMVLQDYRVDCHGRGIYAHISPRQLLFLNGSG